MRSNRILGAVLAAALVGAASPAARADDSGGTPSPSATGGVTYGAAVGRGPRPVASVFRLSTSSVRVGAAAPRLTLRVRQSGVRAVNARVLVRATSAGARATILTLGQIRVGTTVTRALPAAVTRRAGTYEVRLSVTDPAGQTLLRSAQAAGRTLLRVTPKPKPKPTPAPTPTPPVVKPTPAPTTPPSTVPSSATRFPVAGPHTFGGSGARFGAGRPGHIHQGQDVPAAEGTPIVAPTAGTITSTSYQADAAGEYIVMDSVDGRSFFFAHCVRKSTAVTEGQTVRAGTHLCDVGATGDADGPHLHFEIWVNGWRSSSKSTPVDPLPQLKAWEAADPRW